MTDVLVVGAGPSGLVMAAELARHGTVPRIIDKARSSSERSKALAVHARTLEVFDDMGIVDVALARGRRLHGASAFSAGSRIAHVSMDELDSPYPFVLCLPQSETERLLRARLEGLGVKVEQETELVGIDQDTQGVEVVLQRPEGHRETARFRYVVGCDGGHSMVRQLLGVSFTGTDLEAVFALADVRFDPDLPADEVSAFFSPQGAVLCVPLPTEGCWRLIASLPEAQEVPPNPSLGLFNDILATRTSVKETLSEPLWLAGFGVRQRKVDSYAVGRVFLAGDAAHCHSPVGGQGMNTGIQDAYNLGWKLALVCQGAGRPELLESYEREREPVARALLDATERGTRAVTLRNSVSRELRNRIVQFLTAFEVVQQRLARTIGELDLNYRKSPIVGESTDSLLGLKWTHSDSREAPSIGDHREFSAAPHAGDRAPDCTYEDAPPKRLFELLRGSRHVLLLFDGHAPTPEGYRNMAGIAERAVSRFRAAIDAHIVVPGGELPAALGDTHSVILDPNGELHRRYGARAECLYLIRPDGYVGFRSQPARWEQLEAHLSRFFY